MLITKRDVAAYTRDRVHEMLGREFRTGDGRVWRVNAISGHTRNDVANFRHVGTGPADANAFYVPVRDELASELRKLNVGLLLDALDNGLIEEV